MKALNAGTRLCTERMRLRVPVDKKDAVVIVACGSFSPPTWAHLRIMEEARNALEAQGVHVVGGFMSPTHQLYGKKSLVDMHHRVNMVAGALADSDWISCDTWECEQEEWTRTALVLRRFQEELDRLYAEKRLTRKATAMLLGGADLIESFPAIKPDGSQVWDDEHVEELASAGIVCISRGGYDLEAVIAQQPILRRYRDKLYMGEMSVETDISSTVVRKLLHEKKSIKYIVHDFVVSYIAKHRLDQTPQWQQPAK